MANKLDTAQFDSKEWDRILKKLESKWTGLGKTNSPVKRALSDVISIFVYKDVMDHFDKEKGPEGSWQEWSDIYAAHMRKIGRGNNKKLQFSGKLRQTFTPGSYRSNSDGIVFYNNAKTKGGFPYAAAHNDGGSKSGRPPQREFMWLSDKGLKGIIGSIEDWLKEGIE
jgi:phage gpG-like protein